MRTAHGEIRADQVVVATHYPILDRGLYFARLEAQRSYCIAARVAGAAADGDGDQRGLHVALAAVGRRRR